MEIDPIPEDVREFLRKHFRDVKDEPPQGDYYVFSMKLQSGEARELKVQRDLFFFSELVSRYLEQYDFLRQLESGNIEIVEPLRA
jgi:hypothetical protein